MIRHARFYLLAIAMLLVCIAGCGSAAEDRLIGSWEGKVEVDQEAVEEQIKQDMKKRAGNPENDPSAGMDENLAEQLAQQMLSQLEKVKFQIEFNADRSYEATGGMARGENQPQTGTWEVVNSSGDTVTVHMTDPEDKDQAMELRFVDNDTMTLQPMSDSDPMKRYGDAITMTFERVE